MKQTLCELCGELILIGVENASGTDIDGNNLCWSCYNEGKEDTMQE